MRAPRHRKYMPQFCREIGLLFPHDRWVLHENLVMDKIGSIRNRSSTATVAAVAPGCGVGSSLFQAANVKGRERFGCWGNERQHERLQAIGRGQGARLKKCRSFGVNLWNTDISVSPVDAKSTVETEVECQQFFLSHRLTRAGGGPRNHRQYCSR